MIDVRRLRVLQVLQHQGSITGAARALHLTPSAVSQQIRLLSQDLGVLLVERQGRGVRLTSAAETLAAESEALSSRWERVIAGLADAEDAPATGTLRLCGFDTAVASLLAPASAQLRAAHPGLSLEIFEAEAPDAEAALLADDAVLAVVLPAGQEGRRREPRLDRRPLVDDPFDLLVSAAHPLAGRASVDLAEAAGEDWIAPPPNADEHRLLTATCTAAGFSPRIIHNAREWNAMVALASHGFGVCLIPRLVPLPAHQAVVRLSLEGSPAPYRRVLTVTRPGSRHTPLIASTVTALEQVAAELPPPLLPDGAASAHHPEGEHRPHRHARG